MSCPNDGYRCKELLGWACNACMNEYWKEFFMSDGMSEAYRGKQDWGRPEVTSATPGLDKNDPAVISYQKAQKAYDDSMGADKDDGVYSSGTMKLRYDLIPGYALSQLAAVYTMGAEKYGDDNYLKGMNWRRVFGAIMRHCWAWMRGETNDQESGIHHMAHAAWGCLTLIEYNWRKLGKDDRALYKT